MRTRRWLAGIGAGALLLTGGVLAGPLGSLAQTPGTAPATEQASGAQAGSNEQSPAYTGSIAVAQDANGMSEADESAALQAQTKITADQAKQAALDANPGTTVGSVELDNENGWLVYSVTLSNGTDVKIDAGNGSVLATEPAGSDERESNGDEGQADGPADVEEAPSH